jgi:hypothetical protein
MILNPNSIYLIFNRNWYNIRLEQTAGKSRLFVKGYSCQTSRMAAAQASVGSFEKFSNGIGVGLYGWRLMKLCKRFYARH